MTNPYWELENHSPGVIRRAKALLPADLGQLVFALLRDSKRSRPLPGDAFEQVSRVYESTKLTHPAYVWEVAKYMSILTTQVTQLLRANKNPAGIKWWDFPKPERDLDIIQRAQRTAILRYVWKQMNKSSESIELPNAPWRTIYDHKSWILCTMEKDDQKCYAFVSDIVLPKGAQFIKVSDWIHVMPVIQKGVKKMSYISNSSAHEIGISEIEEQDNVMSFKTWWDTPHVVIPDAKNTGAYIHDQGTLEWVFWWDIVVIKTENSLVIRDTRWFISCEVPNNLTSTVEKDGIRLLGKYQLLIGVWPRENASKPIAELNCNTWFLSFSDFREIVKQAS